MEYYLFLDDLRVPEQAYSYTKFKHFLDLEWVIVRDYDSFVDTITKFGLPTIVAFDHDLAPSHYTPPEYWDDYNKSKEWQESQTHTEKTGYDCALWLINYCKSKNAYLPGFYCHSMNPVGRDNILRALNKYNYESRYFQS